MWWAVTRGQMEGPRTKPRYVNRFYAFVTPYSYIMDDEHRTRGANLYVSEKFIRIPAKSVDPTAKNFHWMDLKLSIYEALRKGADWSVLTDGNGNLTEAPGCNVFLIKNGVVKTPASGCLEGITRKTVFDLAKEMKLPLEVTNVTAQELIDADEAFLTSTSGGIMPAARVNDRPLGGRNGPGEITTRSAQPVLGEALGRLAGRADRLLDAGQRRRALMLGTVGGAERRGRASADGDDVRIARPVAVVIAVAHRIGNAAHRLAQHLLQFVARADPLQRAVHAAQPPVALVRTDRIRRVRRP